MAGPRARVLICDDEAAARLGVRRALGEERYELAECADGAACLEALGRDGADLVLLDLRMPVLDGRATLERIVALAAPPPVVVLTADASLRSAIDAVKAGAADYLAKPFEIDELRLVVERTLEAARLRRENLRLAAEVDRLGGGGALVGESPAMRRLLGEIERVAAASAPVLIRGETGTGKERVARLLHERSAVSRGPFVALNCAAIPENLVESELFGHRRGAFTGADRDRRGRLEEAHRGTLFLDEVAELSPVTQARLLRVLEDGRVEPVGGGKAVQVELRLLAATNRDLDAWVRDGRFREDLLFRLRVVELRLPPLRERGEDVILLARHFLARASRPLVLDAGAEAALRAHGWPGNVRELRNAVERAVIFVSGALIRAADLPAELRGGAGGVAPAAADFPSAKRRAVETFERDFLTTALRAARGNIAAAARAVGLKRQNLQAKLAELGIDAAEFRSGDDPTPD